MDITFKLSNSEYKDLVSYCNLNDKLLSEVVKKSFTAGFNIEKYGLMNSEKQPPEIKEVIVEKTIEVPVEVIKIEYVDVEKPVEKIVEVVKDNEKEYRQKIDALQQTIYNLKQENIEKDKKIVEMERELKELINSLQEKRAVYLKNSNLEDALYLPSSLENKNQKK